MNNETYEAAGPEQTEGLQQNTADSDSQWTQKTIKFIKNTFLL